MQNKWQSSFCIRVKGLYRLLPKVSCAYGLYDGEELLYIGSTLNLCQRICVHVHKHKADTVQWIECDPAGLLELENTLIEELKPSLNVIKMVLNTKRPKWIDKQRAGNQ